MAVSIDTTVEGASSNAYGDATEGDAYFANLLGGAAWKATKTSDRKNQACIMATQRIEQEVGWDGSPSSSTQALSFPRKWVWDEETDDYIASSTIPALVKSAMFELAEYLLDQFDVKGKDPTKPSTLKNFSSLSVAGISIVPRNVTDMPLPAHVERMLSRFKASGGSVRLERA